MVHYDHLRRHDMPDVDHHGTAGRTLLLAGGGWRVFVVESDQL
jgi:hypothetical protein